jgi:hypothetical protein
MRDGYLPPDHIDEDFAEELEDYWADEDSGDKPDADQAEAEEPPAQNSGKERP